MRKLALALLAACGSPSPKQQVVLIDAPIDTTPDSPPAQPTQIEVDVFGGTPSLVVYRDGAGAWQPATAGTTTGEYIVTVTADYQVVVACHDSASAFSELLQATAADGFQFVFCTAGGPSMPATVAMTGNMLQAGSVVFGDTASSTTAPWNFTLNVTTGFHDLIATSTAHGIVLRRNQNVAAAGAIPSIDVATEGTAMTATDLTINNLGSDTLVTELDLLTQYGFAMWKGSTATIYPAPASLLTSFDAQLLAVQAQSATGLRFAETQFDGSQTTFDLPAPLTGIVFGPAKASWGTLGSYSQATLDMRQAGTFTVEQQIVATQAWIDATHATQLSFDVTPPGFDASWSINSSASYQGSFQTSLSQGTLTTGSVAFDGAPVQRTPKRPWFSTVARLRESMRSQHTIPRR